MKNVFKVIYALIAIALVYVLYLVALGNRYHFGIGDNVIYDKWEQKSMIHICGSPYEWQDWDEDPRNKKR